MSNNNKNELLQYLDEWHDKRAFDEGIYMLPLVDNDGNVCKIEIRFNTRLFGFLWEKNYNKESTYEALGRLVSSNSSGSIILTGGEYLYYKGIASLAIDYHSSEYTHEKACLTVKRVTDAILSFDIITPYFAEQGEKS